jgi:tetraacyldisaccharide 4'-kinase
MQIFRRYPKVVVSVGEDRVDAVSKLLSHENNIDLILLDDAFQHRKIKADLSIVLTTYSNRFYKDYLMPYGLLREGKHSIDRADIVIVTKCPADISEKKKAKIKRKIYEYLSPEKPIFFTYIKYSNPQPVYFSHKGFELSKNVLLFTGIANPQPFVGYISQQFHLQKFIKYDDHHHYTLNDAKHIISVFESIEIDNKCIITTEKDMVKLHKLEIFELLKNYPVFFIPMEVKFLDREDAFRTIVSNL